MDKKGLILVLSTALISGVSIFLNKYAVSGIDSSIFTFSKNIVVAAVLVSIMLLLKWGAFSSLKGKDWLMLSIIGLVGGSIPFLLFFRGLQMISGPMGSFIHKLMFLFVAVLAILFLKERLRKEFFLGGIALLAGSFLLLKMKGFTMGSGELLVLAATVLWAAENTISKHALKRIDPVIVAAGRMGFGAFFIFAFLVFTGKATILLTLSMEQILWILSTSALLLGYVLTWYHGLKLVDVTVAATVLLVGAPVTTLLSMLASGYKAGVFELIGAGLVLSGVVVAIGLGEVFYARRWKARG